MSNVSTMATAAHPEEPHAGSVSAKLNWLRAGVLGANDGIVSTAGIVVGVAAATAAPGPILTATRNPQGDCAGTLCDRPPRPLTALPSKERGELREDPAAELDELRRCTRPRIVDDDRPYGGRRAHRPRRSPHTPMSNSASIRPI